MGFVSDSDRNDINQARKKKEEERETARTEERVRKARAARVFCEPSNIRDVVRAVKDEVVKCLRDHGYVEVEHVEVTHQSLNMDLFANEEAEQFLLTALKQIEPAARLVVIKDQLMGPMHILVRFSPPIS